MRETKDEQYYKEHGFSKDQIDQFKKQQQIWVNDFLSQMKTHPHKKFAQPLLKLLTVIHDRGQIFAPSTFNGHDFRNYYFSMKGELYVMAWGQRNKGIGDNAAEV